MANIQRSMPLFTKTFDFLTWLVPLSHHFPKNHRHTITRRLIDAALDFQERLIDANETRGGRRRAYLADADRYLGRIRVYIRLALRLKWISSRQYEHAGRQLAEVGRLLGGWIKATKETATPRV